MDEDLLSQPVLVYGPRKAGTTLLQSLLDGGSAMLMLPDELKLKYMVRPDWPFGKPAAAWFIERGRSFFGRWFRIAPDGRTVERTGDAAVAGLTGEQVSGILDPDAYAAGLGELLARGVEDPGELMRGDARAFMAALKIDKASYRGWASKEVGGDPAKVTALFLRSFPEGRVVYLVRQPEFIVRSIIMDRRRKGKAMSLRGILHECRDAQNVVNFGHAHASRGGLVVSYETLTADTQRVVNRLCDELGLPHDPVHEGPTTLGQAVVVITSSRQTTKVFRQEADWKKDLTAREVLAIRLFNSVAPAYYKLMGGRKVAYGEVRALLDPIGL
jgi:hypothetical protein